MANSLYVKKLTRWNAEGEPESVEFVRGVNTMFGEPNAGKTVWMSMLDYVLGDTGNVADAFGNQQTSDGTLLMDKYTRITAELEVGDEALLLERDWTEPGSKTKILVGENVSVGQGDFSSFFLQKLGLPLLHFPKGNPYAERSWPELSWRMLFRHMYRQERFWSDIADRQPEAEQFAAICMFLGIADRVFPQQLGDIVGRRKLLVRMEAERDQFETVLDRVAKELSRADDPPEFVTQESVAASIAELESHLEELATRRESAVQAVAEEQHAPAPDEELLARRAACLAKQEGLQIELRRVNSRLAEFAEIRSATESQMSRLQRALVAGELLKPVRASHCPACNQEVTPATGEDVCYLCHQNVSAEEHGAQRVELEIRRLQTDLDEEDSVISTLRSDAAGVERELRQASEELAEHNSQLAALRKAYTALQTSDIALIDAERGRTEEQIASHRRILASLDTKADILSRIDELTGEIAGLQGELDALGQEIEYATLTSAFEEEMHNFFNKLNETRPGRWNWGRVDFSLNARGFGFRVGQAKWTSLGATAKVYFLFAYHYALLALAARGECECPGLLIIDFPPELADVDIEDKENYLAQPFVDLAETNPDSIQVVFSGRSFQNLEGANPIPMGHVWR